MDIAYKKQIVAFIDVLGFSNIVYSGNDEALKDYFSYVIEEFAGDRKKYKFEYILISDAIVIYTDCNKSNLQQLCIAIGKLQMKLIMRGIVMRGGISFGNLFIDGDKNVIVGSALINAYKLEQEAGYPRVVLDRGFIKEFYDSAKDMLNKNNNRLLIDPPHPYEADLPYIYFTRKLALVMQPKKLQIVVDLMAKNLSENRNAKKYLWLKSHIEMAINQQLEYLKRKATPSRRDPTRIRHLEKFKAGIEVL